MYSDPIKKVGSGGLGICTYRKQYCLLEAFGLADHTPCDFWAEGGGVRESAEFWQNPKP